MKFSARVLDDIPLEEVRDAYEQYTSYFGTYTLDPMAGTIVHHVEGALVPNWVGGNQLRYFSLDEGALTLKTPPMKLTDGTKVVNFLTWVRAQR